MSFGDWNDRDDDDPTCPDCHHLASEHTWTHGSIAGPPEPTCRGGCGCESGLKTVDSR